MDVTGPPFGQLGRPEASPVCDLLTNDHGKNERRYKAGFATDHDDTIEIDQSFGTIGDSPEAHKRHQVQAQGDKQTANDNDFTNERCFGVEITGCSEGPDCSNHEQNGGREHDPANDGGSGEFGFENRADDSAGNFLIPSGGVQPQDEKEHTDTTKYRT